MKKIFNGKKVLIMGLGLHGGGAAAAKFFAKHGAHVLVTDLKTKEQLKESVDNLKGLKISFALGGHREEDFKTADLVIKNPDVPWSSPYLKIAKENKIPVETDTSLFFKMAEGFIIGVTGTKGKSTTASLIYHLLKPKARKIYLAGNIGVSPLEILPKIKKGDKVVLELSSFELEGLQKSPSIAVVTNIMPDHLNRYSGMQDYIEAKKNIFKYQGKNDFLVLNGDDSIVRQFGEKIYSKPVYFSGQSVSLAGMKIFGEHNKFNVAAAVEVARLLKVPESSIKKSLKSFKGVKSRQEFVAEIKGIKYFNDTAATMPDAVIAALKAFSEKFSHSKLILISGGQDKGLGFGQMCREIKNRAGELVLLPGTASDKIKQDLADWKKRVYGAQSMEEAVKTAAKLAGKGDIVVLSPGAASFNLFKNEFDRGDKFVAAVKKLKK